MVRLKEEGSVTAKIIDLGLAKSVNEPGSRTTISLPGGFAGTPEFASPEQFAGVGVDIRSDLYALGVTLWQMLTGHPVFRGSPAEVMCQHQHAPLPFEQLKDVSQPVVVLLEKLLEKDPVQRFQNTAELLQTMPTVTGAIDAGRKITRQSILKTPQAVSRARTGLATRTHGWARRGRKANGWRGSFGNGALYWCWTAWSRFNTRQALRRGAYASLRSKRCCASWPASTKAFAWSRLGCRWRT
jgi:serine/threonine protein kinase